MTTLILLAGCRSAPEQAVESLNATEDVSAFVLNSVRGTRDGERLDVQASYGDGSRNLALRLEFNVTPPARLTSGTWSGVGSQGEVRERAVTFLGGQSGFPSIGGRFDLIGPDGRPLYRVHIPLQELKQPL